MTRDEFIKYLQDDMFNEGQIALILSVRSEFEAFKFENESDESYSMLLDSWEREQWHTFNNSGLFESNEDNLSGITNWKQTDTRLFITEIDIEL